jgi:hypothetical protein
MSLKDGMVGLLQEEIFAQLGKRRPETTSIA